MECGYGQSQCKITVSRPVNAFCKPQQQGESQPNKYYSLESQVIQVDMEGVRIQVIQSAQLLFQITNLLTDKKLQRFKNIHL